MKIWIVFVRVFTMRLPWATGPVRLGAKTAIGGRWARTAARGGADADRGAARTRTAGIEGDY